MVAGLMIDLELAELVAKLRCQKITYATIAKQLGVTTERARQIEAQYVRYMKNIKPVTIIEIK